MGKMLEQLATDKINDKYIIINLKGAIRDFYNLRTAPRTVSKTYAQVARVIS